MAADSDRAGRHRAVTPGVCVLALLLAGCGGGATGKGSRLTGAGDPLVGPVTPAGSPSVASIGAPTAGIPPLPAPSASTAPAALATKTAPSLSPDRSATSTPAGVWREPSSGAQLSMPKPPTRGSAAPPTPSPTGFVVPAGGPGAIQSIDQGLKALEQRGARGFRLELQRDTAQWRCSCSVSNRQNPAYKQTYDTTAADPLSAVRAIVERLERENP